MFFYCEGLARAVQQIREAAGSGRIAFVESPGIEAGQFRLVVAQQAGEGGIAFQDAPIEVAECDADSSGFENLRETEVAIEIGSGLGEGRKCWRNFHTDTGARNFCPTPDGLRCGRRKPQAACGIRVPSWEDFSANELASRIRKSVLRREMRAKCRPSRHFCDESREGRRRTARG